MIVKNQWSISRKLLQESIRTLQNHIFHLKHTYRQNKSDYSKQMLEIEEKRMERLLKLREKGKLYTRPAGKQQECLTIVK